jgi:flagellar biosynthetic protein FlhB
MAEESSGQEKTEEPTSRRLQEAKDKGDIAKSTEIPSAAVLLSALMTIYFMSDYMIGTFEELTRHYLANSCQIEVIPANTISLLEESLIYGVMILGPLMLAVMLAGLIANYAQVGVVFTTEKIAPDIKKIDPIKGMAQKFSLQALAELLKSLLKIGLIGYVAYNEVNKALPQFMPLLDETPYQIMNFAGRTAFWIFLKCSLTIAILAALDYAFQRWQFINKMKMTKQEVKEEAKSTEGDPQVKGRIRSLQMQMARSRMMDEVPQADVIITNPTRLNVALKYNAAEMAAPVVVAMGAGSMAHRIKEIATENAVPILEDKPLARALYKSSQVGQPIPENLFQAVAEILAYVYGIKNKAA